MKNMMLIATIALISMPGMAATKKIKPISYKEHVQVKSIKAKPLRSDNLAALINRVIISENYRKPAIDTTKSI